MNKHYLVGITGGSASGKTSFLHQLHQKFLPSDICVISQDNYYKPFHEIPIDDKGVQNFDLPETIDFQKFYTDIQRLQKGETIEIQEYAFNNISAKSKVIQLRPASIILVEGIYVFYDKKIYDGLDLKLFIDAPDISKLKRRIRRDSIERGYDIEDVLYRWEYHVTPLYQQYVHPLKEKADLIIQNTFGFEVAIEVLCNHLKSLLKKQDEL